MDPLEAKILGEKAQYYCSSSEDSDSEYESASENEAPKASQAEAPKLELKSTKWEGVSQNTGPKGVMKDMQVFRKLQREKRQEMEQNRIALVKKFTLSVQTALDEEREKAMREDPDLVDLLDDEFVVEYQRKRMLQLMEQYESRQHFGKVFHLKNGTEFLKAIDDEDELVTIIIHIYEDDIEACRLMNDCFEEVSQIYLNTKFCTIKSTNACVSTEFKNQGLPALLIYKKGNLIYSFLRITDRLGDHFYAEDLLQVLVGHGILVDKSLCPPIIASLNDSSSDSS